MTSSDIPVSSVPQDAEPIFKPIFGKIVIKVDDEPERKYGQLFLPARSKSQSTIGKIHAVYEGYDSPDGRVEPEVSVGQTVLFGQYTGTSVTIGRQLFVICKEHDLLTVVEFPEKAPPVEEVV